MVRRLLMTMSKTPLSRGRGAASAALSPQEGAGSSSGAPRPRQREGGGQSDQSKFSVLMKIDLKLNLGEVVRVVVFTGKAIAQHDTTKRSVLEHIRSNKALRDRVHMEMLLSDNTIDVHYEAPNDPDREVPLWETQLIPLREGALNAILGEPSGDGGEGVDSVDPNIISEVIGTDWEATPIRSIWANSIVARIQRSGQKAPLVQQNLEIEQDTHVVVVAYEDQSTEPPLNKYPTEYALTNNSTRINSISAQQHVFLVRGEEGSAVDMARQFAGNANVRTHMLEGGVTCNIHIIYDQEAQHRALEAAAMSDTPIFSPAIPGTPAFIGRISTRYPADPRKTCGDILEAPIKLVIAFQAEYSAGDPIRTNFFDQLLTTTRMVSLRMPSTARYLRYAVTEAPAVLHELLTDEQQCDRCHRRGPVRVGTVKVSGRDLAENKEEYVKVSKNMGLCVFCLAGWTSDDIFHGAHKLCFDPGTDHYVVMRPDPLPLIESGIPGMIEDLRGKEPAYSDSHEEQRLLRQASFLEKYSMMSLAELDAKQEEVVQEYLLEVNCAGCEDRFNKTKIAHIKNMKVFISGMTIWAAHPTPTESQRELIRTALGHLRPKDQDKHMVDVLDCVALATYRQELITLRRQAEEQHPGISRWIPISLFLRLAYKQAVQREAVLVQIRSKQTVQNAIQLELTNADATEALYRCGIDGHIKQLQETLDLRSTAEYIPGILYTVRYTGEDPVRFLETFSNLYATACQIQHLFGGSLGSLVYMRNLLRAVAAHDRDLERDIKRSMRDKNVIYEEIRTDEQAEQHAVILDYAVRTNLIDARRRRARDRYRPGSISQLSSERSTEQGCSSDSEEEDHEVSVRVAEGTPPIGLPGSSRRPWRSERGRRQRSAFTSTERRRSKSPQTKSPQTTFAPLPEGQRTSFFAIQGESSRSAKVRCYNCGVFGHFARNCKLPSRFKDSTKQPDKPKEYTRQLIEAGFDAGAVKGIVAVEGIATRNLSEHTVAQLRAWEMEELEAELEGEEVRSMNSAPNTQESEPEATSDEETTDYSSEFDSDN